MGIAAVRGDVRHLFDQRVRIAALDREASRKDSQSPPHVNSNALFSQLAAQRGLATEVVIVSGRSERHRWRHRKTTRCAANEVIASGNAEVLSARLPAATRIFRKERNGRRRRVPIGVLRENVWHGGGHRKT